MYGKRLNRRCSDYRPGTITSVLAVRANPEDLTGVLDFIEEKWKSQGTNQIFGGRLQEDLMQEEKDINGSILKVNLFLAVVATLLIPGRDV